LFRPNKSILFPWHEYFLPPATPDVTEKFCDRLIPGIAEYLRSESIKQTINAVISRGIAGVKDKTIIINLPGSVKRAAFCTELLIPIVLHAVKMVRGEGH